MVGDFSHSKSYVEGDSVSEIDFCSRREVSTYSKSRKYKSLISLSSSCESGDKRPPKFFQRFKGPKLRMHFDDRDNPVEPEQILEIVKFAETCPLPILIHDLAGVSRCASAAIIVGAVRGIDVMSDLDGNEHWPNERMLELADNQLGTQLTRQIQEWKIEESRNWALESGFYEGGLV